MLAALIIVFREVFEAGLIVGIVLAVTRAVQGRNRWIGGGILAGVVAACCWGGSFFLSAIGVYQHQIWLLWIGSGVIGGCGLGLGYISPVSTLIKWFPDRRGMATGLAIMLRPLRQKGTPSARPFAPGAGRRADDGPPDFRDGHQPR